MPHLDPQLQYSNSLEVARAKGGTSAVLAVVCMTGLRSLYHTPPTTAKLYPPSLPVTNLTPDGLSRFSRAAFQADRPSLRKIFANCRNEQWPLDSGFVCLDTQHTLIESVRLENRIFEKCLSASRSASVAAFACYGIPFRVFRRN